MKATFYLTLQAITLYFRTRASLFTMVVMPIIMFFIYMSIFAAGRPERVIAFLGPVLVLMATTNGVYGIGGDLLIMRESGTLLPYRLAPVTPLQIIVSRLFVDFVLTLLVGAVEVALAVRLYHMPFRANPWDLLVIASLATAALGMLGTLIINVANSFPEANMLSQILFLALLIMSGLTLPLERLPGFARGIAHFLPTTMLVTSFNGVLVNGDRLAVHWREIVVLILFVGTCGAAASLLFRWDKEQKSTWRDRILAAIALTPLVLAGVWFNL
jgi:ABC-2 type transport system permease protein